MTYDTPRRIVLASASPRRQELLKLVAPEFEVVPSYFDESTMPEDLTPADHVTLSAREKAREVAGRVSDAVIIGADTVVAVGEGILGKPKDEQDAKDMLNMLSGRVHQVYTGICVIDSGQHRHEECRFACTDVRFDHLSEDVIDRYVATGEPMDKAGAYAIQGYASVLIEGIEGCYFNVVGLPVHKLSKILKGFGVSAF